MKRIGWLALALLAVVPYARALSSPLLYDDRTLLDNQWLAREAGLVSVFQHDYWYGTKHAGSDLYRPLTVLSLAWNLRASPTKEGIRTVNVALHAAATLAVYWMLGGIVGTTAAWLGAALFAVHPLGSEAVLWAVGRAEIAAMILGIVAFMLFAKLREVGGLGGARLLFSMAAFLAALCFKESAASWLAIGAAWVLLAPNGCGPRRLDAARAACYLAVLAVYVAGRAAAVGWTRLDVPFIDNPLSHVDAATRAVNAVLLFARYAGKMLAPVTLSVEYGFDQLPVVRAFPLGAAGAALVVGAVAAGVVVLARKGQCAVAFLLAFVPCAFAVTGNLAFPIGTVFAERLAYTPLLGACGLAGCGLAAIPRRTARVAVAALLIAAGGFRTFVRAGDYRSLATLSAATAEASPRAVKALVNAARTRMRAGDAAAASPLLERAVALWPDYAAAWRLLAAASAAQGDAARASEARKRAEALSSGEKSGDDPL